MAEARVERRLAAILAADVAGYSRLMGADEEDTLARLKAHRSALVDPKIDVEGVFREGRYSNDDYQKPQNAPSTLPFIIVRQPKCRAQTYERQGGVDLH